MTTSEPDPSPTFDPLDDLTIAELDAGSRLLKASLVKAIAEQTVDYEKALAVVGYLHARRTDRTTKPDDLLKEFTSLRYSALSDRLQSFAPPAQETEGPTTPKPE